MNFIKNCKEVPFLNKIKFNYYFSACRLKEFQIVLTNPFVFPNLKTLEFEDVAFTFKSKSGLISFIDKELSANSLLSPHVSYIKMAKGTDFLKL